MLRLSSLLNSGLYAEISNSYDRVRYEISLNGKNFILKSHCINGDKVEKDDRGNVISSKTTSEIQVDIEAEYLRNFFDISKNDISMSCKWNGKFVTREIPINSQKNLEAVTVFLIDENNGLSDEQKVNFLNRVMELSNSSADTEKKIAMQVMKETLGGNDNKIQKELSTSQWNALEVRMQGSTEQEISQAVAEEMFKGTGTTFSNN